MKVVNWLRGDRRPPEERQSYVRERTLLSSNCCPIFSLHHSVVCCGTAKGNLISLIVCSHAGEGAAASDANP